MIDRLRGADTLNDSQRRTLAATFAHVDELLSSSLAQIASASPLNKLVKDLSDPELRILSDYVLRVRDQLASAFAQLGIPMPRPSATASKAIATAALFAISAIDEVRPPRLQGYGDLDDTAALAVERAEASILRSLEQLYAFAARGRTRDLAGRLERLAREPVSPELLRAVERIIRERGLVEYRANFESVLERLETPRFEVAVFGRVSCGKSSLLNAILGRDVLPVGITPVTTVPTRIVWSANAQIEIEFANAPARREPLEKLAEYVTEMHNPENQKAVARITVCIDAPALRNGLVLVDTPGVGSLAVWGSRTTYAYLPRCDHGVVMIDPGGALTSDDLELLRLLFEAGIGASILISKSDLLQPEAREELRRFTHDALARELGVDMRVELVSAVAEGGAMARQWFDRWIVPLASSAARSSDALIRRKSRAIAESVLATLRARAGSAAPVADEAAEDILFEAERALEDARSAAHLLRSAGPRWLADALAHAAGAIARAESNDVSAPRAIASAAKRTSSEARRLSSGILEYMREKLRALLSRLPWAAGASCGADLLPLETATQPQLLMPDPQMFQIGRAAILKIAPRLQQRYVQRELEARSGPFAAAFETFARDLAAWTEAEANRLYGAFSGHVTPAGALARAGPSRSSEEADIAMLERLLTGDSNNSEQPREKAPIVAASPPRRARQT